MKYTIDNHTYEIDFKRWGNSLFSYIKNGLFFSRNILSILISHPTVFYLEERSGFKFSVLSFIERLGYKDSPYEAILQEWYKDFELYLENEILDRTKIKIGDTVVVKPIHSSDTFDYIGKVTKVDSESNSVQVETAWNEIGEGQMLYLWYNVERLQKIPKYWTREDIIFNNVKNIETENGY
jgi:hypothetical protein